MIFAWDIVTLGGKDMRQLPLLNREDRIGFALRGIVFSDQKGGRLATRQMQTQLLDEKQE